MSRDIVMQRVKEIVSNEHRPVSLLDFLPSFEVEGNVYHMKYGTLRNIISNLRSTRQIQIAFKTKQTFYTLPGITFGRSKMMTPYGWAIDSKIYHVYTEMLKPEEIENDYERILISMPKQKVAELDKGRSSMPRSTYLSSLVGQVEKQLMKTLF